MVSPALCIHFPLHFFFHHICNSAPSVPDSFLECPRLGWRLLWGSSVPVIPMIIALISITVTVSTCTCCSYRSSTQGPAQVWAHSVFPETIPRLGPEQELSVYVWEKRKEEIIWRKESHHRPTSLQLSQRGARVARGTNMHLCTVCPSGCAWGRTSSWWQMEGEGYVCINGS